MAGVARLELRDTARRVARPDEHGRPGAGERRADGAAREVGAHRRRARPTGGTARAGGRRAPRRAARRCRRRARRRGGPRGRRCRPRRGAASISGSAAGTRRSSVSLRRDDARSSASGSDSATRAMPAVPGQADAAGERGGEVVAVALELEARGEELLGVAARGRAAARPSAIAAARRAEAALERDAVRRSGSACRSGRRAARRRGAEVRVVGRSSPAPLAFDDDALARRSPRARSRGRAPRRRSRSPGRGSPSSPARARDAARSRRRPRRGSRQDRLDDERSRARRISAFAVSLRPWPVTTQTTRLAGVDAALSSAASPAADDGSQKRPSLVASSSQASTISSSVTVTISTGVSATSASLAMRRLGDADRGGERVARSAACADDEPRRLRPSSAKPWRTRGVAAAAVREREHVGRAAELLDDLERRRLLALDPVRVERVDEHVRAALGELAGSCERLVEAAAHLEHPRADSARLGELRRRDRARRASARPPSARRAPRTPPPTRRCSRSTRRRRLAPVLDRLRDRDGHAAVLEAAGRVRALPLELELDAEPLREPRRTGAAASSPRRATRPASASPRRGAA